MKRYYYRRGYQKRFITMLLQLTGDVLSDDNMILVSYYADSNRSPLTEK